jgi:hypothetical protein
MTEQKGMSGWLAKPVVNADDAQHHSPLASFRSAPGSNSITWQGPAAPPLPLPAAHWFGDDAKQINFPSLESTLVPH